MSSVYELAKKFKQDHSGTIAWRLKAHSKVIEKHLNPGETVQFVFAGQKSHSPFDIFSTYVVVLTNKRILLAQKRVLFGYLYLSITPEMFNDLTLKSGLFWGTVYIDTIKEVIAISKLSKSSLPIIETQITEYMMEEKKNYEKRNGDSE